MPPTSGVKNVLPVTPLTSISAAVSRGRTSSWPDGVRAPQGAVTAPSNPSSRPSGPPSASSVAGLSGKAELGHAHLQVAQGGRGLE